MTNVPAFFDTVTPVSVTAVGSRALAVLFERRRDR